MSDFQVVRATCKSGKVLYYLKGANHEHQRWGEFGVAAILSKAGATHAMKHSDVIWGHEYDKIVLLERLPLTFALGRGVEQKSISYS